MSKLYRSLFTSTQILTFSYSLVSRATSELSSKLQQFEFVNKCEHIANAANWFWSTVSVFSGRRRADLKFGSWPHSVLKPVLYSPSDIGYIDEFSSNRCIWESVFLKISFARARAENLSLFLQNPQLFRTPLRKIYLAPSDL